MRRLLRALLLLTAPLLAGYEVKPLQRVLVAQVEAGFAIIADEPISLDELPDQERLVWLGAENAERWDGKHQLNVRFFTRMPGAVVFPTLKGSIGGNEVLLRLPDHVAEPNPVPEGATRFVLFFNGDPTPPERVHLGEKLDVDILAISSGLPPLSSRQAFGGLFFRGRVPEIEIKAPDLEIDGVTWKIFGSPRPREDPRFFLFPRSGMRFEESERELEGQRFLVRRFKCRCHFSALGTAKGQIHLPISYRSSVRHHVFPFSVEVEPLPPAPVEDVIATGLIGEWIFDATFDPPQPKRGETFTIRLEVQGNGDPLALEDLNFSGPGFPSSLFETEVHTPDSSDRWEATVVQTLIPNGQVARFRPLTLTSFDTVADQWRRHELSPALPVEDALPEAAVLEPTTVLGPAVARPVLLNLHPSFFALLALGPLLPLGSALAVRLWNRRDPEKARKRKLAQDVIRRLRKGEVDDADIDQRILPLLRYEAGLPEGASAREVADEIEERHPDLAELLRAHAARAFGGDPSLSPPMDSARIADALAKLSLSLVLVLMLVFVGNGSLSAADLDSGRESFEAGRYDEATRIYSTLIEESPGQAGLYLNLARSQLARGEAARARAACHSALLLEPRNGEARLLLAKAMEQMGKTSLPGTRLLAFRPDQILVTAAVLWFLGFLVLALRWKRWPGAALIGLGLLLGVLGLARNSRAYAAGQYMVITDDLPREPEAGQADWTLPTIEAGEILVPADTTDTHARIEGAGDLFWLPLKNLERVW